MASRWILNLWEASTYKISENFIKRFGFWKFSSFGKNTLKRLKRQKNGFEGNFYLPKSIYIQKLQKILSNGLDLDNCIQFWPKNTKKAKKGQNKKSGFEVNSYSLRSIYIQNFRKFHQTVWILTILFIFGQKIPKWLDKAKIENMASRWILNRWEASTYKISENFIKRFGFWQFSLLSGKKYQKG